MIRVVESESSPASTIDASFLAAFPAFNAFTRAELEELLRSMTRWDVRAGTLLFSEGDAGHTCYVVVRGVVDVSVKVRGQAQLLAQLGPGAIFGQMSVIDGAPRSASCSIRRDAILAEIDAEACERLLDDGSALALKLLGALAQGLVAALRSADRQLMRIDGDDWTLQFSQPTV
jgi:CRP-like cAMP-binding protein